MNSNAEPFVRFWWLAVIGLCAAAVAGLAVLYHIEPGIPPELEERTPASYTAKSRLLVNSRENPIIRTGVTEVTPRAPRSGDRADRPPVVETSPPGLSALVDAANLLPLVVESDAVARIRRAEIGRPSGTVTAQALFARETPGGGLRPSSLPVIEVTAVSPTARGATMLVQGTIDAFDRWLVREQERFEIPESQRIVVQELTERPRLTVEEEKSWGLAAVVAGAVLAGVALLITLLHRLFPRKADGRLRRLFAPRPVASETTDGDSIHADGEGAGAPRDRLEAWLDEPIPEDVSEQPEESRPSQPG